ncbi:MAG: hypothetical protein ACYSUY_03190 [Planctomycetota bacterium]|jgi:hypothetical protein
MDKQNDIIFHEVQPINPWFRNFTAILMASIVIFLIAIVRHEQGWATSPCVILGIVVSIGASILVWIMKLETVVRSDGLYVRFFPIHLRSKRFTAENIKKYYTRKYRPFLEYGGWGLKLGLWIVNGWSYTVSGNKGVQLVLTNGKKLLIGSQKPDDLVAAIDQMPK